MPLRRLRLLRHLLTTSTFILLLSACGAPLPTPERTPLPTATATPAPAAAQPTTPPTAAATAADVLLPTSTPSPAATPDWTLTASVAGDYYLLGNPDAPIRLVDYSDFL